MCAAPVQVLCTKKGGDMLWVPAVEKYAESTAVKEHKKNETSETTEKKKVMHVLV